LLIFLLSFLPFLIQSFSKIKSKKSSNAKQIIMNFDASLSDEEIQSISSDSFVKNFSVKKLGKSNELSVLAKFTSSHEKDIFLKKWNNRIKNYDISFDEID
jgi:hypothetical protein